VHVELQQTPSVQAREAHWLFDVHAVPLPARGLQTPDAQ
jgi:hypothetical protein